MLGMVIQMPVILNIHNTVCVCQFYDMMCIVLKDKSPPFSSMGGEMLNE